MADKLPFFAAESGTWKTTSPNPHIDLSGTALTLGNYPVHTFAAAAADTTLDFASTSTCTVVAWVDASNWRRYEGAVWTDATPDTLNLSAATLMGAAGTISADAAVSVVASLPSTMDHGALIGLTDNDHPQYEILHGVAAAGALSFDNSTHIVTMASGTNTYWFQGAKYTTASAVTCDLDNYVTLTTNTLYYVAFDDASGTLKASATPWSLTTKVPVAMVFWNGSAGALTYECHNHTRDLDWHAWAHLTVGARYGSGLTQTLPSTAVDGSLQIESGTIYDEDIAFTIAQQTTMRGWYQASAGVYTFADYALPYLGTAGAPVFLDTDTYALSSFASNNYVCYWAYAAPDMARPIYVVPTQRSTAYGTVASARAEAAPSLSALNLSPEMKLVYRWIYAGDGQYQEGADYRLTSPLPSGGSASTTAGAVSFAPAGNIAATTVQAAIEELDTEKAPLAHAANHASGGSDAVKLDDLAAPDDNTDLNASITAHGLLHKATAPASGSLNVSGIANAETTHTEKTIFIGLLQCEVLTEAAYQALGAGRPATKLYFRTGT